MNHTRIDAGAERWEGVRINELERVRHGVTKNQCRLPDSIWRNGQNSPEYDSGITDKERPA